MTSYESLKDFFGNFILYNEEENSNTITINIYNFDINKFKKKESLLTQYILFIIFKIKEKLPKKTDIYAYMKNVKRSQFYPLYLNKVLKPLNKILKDENSPHLVNKVYIHDVGKSGVVIWNIVKHLFHKDTVKKITLINQ